MSQPDIHPHLPDHPNPDQGPNVTIKVNGQLVQIHRGHQTVTQIKASAGVHAAEELEQLIDGVLTPLPDDGAVTIKGGEVFVSHVRSSASS